MLVMLPLPKYLEYAGFYFLIPVFLSLKNGTLYDQPGILDSYSGLDPTKLAGQAILLFIFYLKCMSRCGKQNKKIQWNITMVCQLPGNHENWR